MQRNTHIHTFIKPFYKCRHPILRKVLKLEHVHAFKSREGEILCKQEDFDMYGGDSLLCNFWGFGEFLGKVFTLVGEKIDLLTSWSK